MDRFSWSDCEGRWALVTGASTGIGREYAVQLAAKGMNLIVTARRGELLDELAASPLPALQRARPSALVHLSSQAAYQPPKFDTFAALWPPLKLANPLPDKHLQDSAG